MDLHDVTTWRAARDRDDLLLGPGEQLVAGGTWTFSEPQPGTTGLVDLTSLGWPAWEETSSGVQLAATCTVAELLASPPSRLAGVADLVGACADALAMSFKVQHAATLGGNVCLALPAGAMTSLLVALDAEAEVWGARCDRRVPVADLVTGVRRTSLGSDEVVRAFEVRDAAIGRRHAFRRQSLATYGRSGVVVTASAGGDLGDVLRLVVTASVTRPVVVDLPARSWRAELGPALAAVDCWFEDAHGAADWRVAMTHRSAAEALAEVA